MPCVHAAVDADLHYRSCDEAHDGLSLEYLMLHCAAKHGIVVRVNRLDSQNRTWNLHGEASHAVLL